MKKLTLLPLALAASPAFAHVGPHLHPHADSANWLPIVAGTLAIGTAAFIMWRQR